MPYDMDYKHDDPKGDPSPAPTSDDDIITTTTSDDDVSKIGALADGFAASAINSTEIDDDSTGYVGGIANGDNRGNSDSSINVDVDLKADISTDNGNNRDNEYDWSYSAKSDDHTDNSTFSDDDTYIKQTTVDDSDSSTDYDWSYYAKSDDHSQVDDHSKVDDHSYTKTSNETELTSKTDSHDASNSFNSSDDDFATIAGVKDFDNLGVAGHDLTFDIGDDFSFTLNLNDILSGDFGNGNNAAFNVVQTNSLVDQDNAYEFSMNNQHANNQLQANAAESDGASGMELDGKTWNLNAGDDANGTSTADSSAILANSGFHLELVQGANMLSNAFDTHVSGTDMHSSSVGEDTSGAADV